MFCFGYLAEIILEACDVVVVVVVVVVVQSSLSMYICTMPVLATDWTLTTLSSCYHDPNLEIL